MDPLTGYVTIVGLLCNFRQEHGARKDLEHRQFIEWLANHKHEDLKNLIVNQAALQTEVDNLLRSDVQTMFGKLEDISKILFSILARLDEFKGLAAAASAPESELSPQAVSILLQFVRSGGGQIIYKDQGGGQYTLLIWSRGNQYDIDLTEPNFIRDDMNSLVGFGFLTVELNGSGGWLCSLTRSGQRFANLMRDKVQLPPEPPLPQ